MSISEMKRQNRGNGMCRRVCVRACGHVLVNVCVMDCSTATLGLPSRDSASRADVDVFTVGLFYRCLENTHTPM